MLDTSWLLDIKNNHREDNELSREDGCARIFEHVDLALNSEDFDAIKKMLSYSVDVELQLLYVVCFLMATNHYHTECGPERSALVDYARGCCENQEDADAMLDGLV